MNLRDKADRLLQIHNDGGMLVLPNVWDPIGARALERKGYPAVATASAAVSAMLGYADGEKLRRETMIDVVGRIARSVDVPVTADIEAGYGATVAELGETIEQVIEAGVAGINLEDSFGGGLRPVDEACERIAAARLVSESLGVRLVINARVDSFVRGVGNPLDEAEARAKAYRAAGADCIYPIGPGDEATVRELRRRIAGPINILATPRAAPLATLREIGVNRVSFGPFVFRSVLRRFVEIAEGLLGDGDYAVLGEPLTQADVAELVRQGSEP